MVLDFTEPYYLDPEPYPAQSPVDMQPVLFFPSHEEQPIFYPASLSQALVEHALPTHLLKSICSLSCFVRDFSSKLLTWWCRSHCLEVVVQHWLLRAPLSISPLPHMLWVWTVAPGTYFFSLALCSKAFIVSLLFLNSCAYLWCYCKWCKYLSKKSLHWAADCPLIFSTLKVWIIISLPTTRGKKNWQSLEMRWKNIAVVSVPAVLRRKMRCSEAQLTLVLVTVVFTTCYGLKDLLTAFCCCFCFGLQRLHLQIGGDVTELLKVLLSKLVPSLQ